MSLLPPLLLTLPPLLLRPDLIASFAHQYQQHHPFRRRFR